MKCVKEYEIRFLTEPWPTNDKGAIRRPLGAAEMQKSFAADLRDYRRLLNL